MKIENSGTALITGASGGLGAHFARLLSKNGFTTILAARQLDKIEEIAAEIRVNGGQASAVKMDVTDSDSIEAAFGEMNMLPNIVINNAGIVGNGMAINISKTQFSKVLDTNLTGALLVSQFAAKHMQSAGIGGSIVNISSILGLRVAKDLVAYSASKAALIQMTKSMALEWARLGIRVNALCPGYIETDLNRAFFQTDSGRDLIKRIPMRRLGRMSDLDTPLLMLVSAGADFITGCALPVDGGHLVTGL